MDVGSVRLTEQFGRTEREWPRRSEPRFPTSTPPASIGVAGTIMSLAALDLDLARHHESEADGHSLSAAEVASQVDELSALSPEEREELEPLNPKRAPFILAGAVILDEVLRRYALDEIEASERDLLDGAALEAAKLPEPEEGEAPPGAYVCC